MQDIFDRLNPRVSPSTRQGLRRVILCLATAVLCSQCVPTDVGENLAMTVQLDTANSELADPSSYMDSVVAVMRRRAAEIGVREAVIQEIGDDRISVVLRGIEDPARATSIITMHGLLEFHITDMFGEFQEALGGIDTILQLEGGFSQFLYGGELPGQFLVPESDFARVDSLIQLADFRRAMPEGIVLRWEAEPVQRGGRAFRGLYAVEAQPILSGDRLAGAEAYLDRESDTPGVNFELTRVGGRAFSAATAIHVGDFMAIVLDERVLGRPPVIRSRIGLRAQIELGDATMEEARDLARILRAGALPVPVRVVDSRLGTSDAR